MRRRGNCQVCGFSAALRNDGMVWRHWAVLLGNPDGTCQGWGKAPR